MSPIISQSYLQVCSLWTQHVYKYPLVIIHIPEYDRYFIPHRDVITMSHSLGCGIILISLIIES